LFLANPFLWKWPKKYLLKKAPKKSEKISCIKNIIYYITIMANKKSSYKKYPESVWIEPRLREILEKESTAAGCVSRPKMGFSISEVSRRFIKGRLIQLRPYIKNSVSDIDWSEAI
jgi:hypothetical protein